MIRSKLKKFYYSVPVFRSLRVRIMVFALMIGIISCSVMRILILTNYEDRVAGARMAEVTTQLNALADHLMASDYLENPQSELIENELDQLTSIYDARILIIDSDLEIIRDTYGMSEGKTIVTQDVVNCLRKGSGGSSSAYVPKNRYIEVIVPIMSREEKGSAGSGGSISPGPDTVSTEAAAAGVLMVSCSTDNIFAMLDALGDRAMIVEIILLLLLSVVIILITLLMVRPFDRLTTAIADVQAGYSSKPVPIRDYLETEHILEAFNQVLGRMRNLDMSRQEFVSNVSHELKTPMTSMKILADSLLQQPDAPIEMYQEFMQDIAQEIDRENTIISELLSLVKLDRPQVNMNISAVKIGELLEIILKRVRPIAQKLDVELILIQERDVTAEIDEVKMTMAITNLVENAVKYNREHGHVIVTLDADPKDFMIRVEDNGCGIPEESLAHIYERFYRVDKSRSREIGGTGLGLSITRTTVLLHRGSIDVASVPGEGTTFTVKIPLIYSAPQNKNAVKNQNSIFGKIRK